MSINYGYLQHGSMSDLPMRTERVPVKAWIDMEETVQGSAGDWFARYEGRWCKVHVQVRCLYIVHHGQRITITIEGV